MHAQGAIKFGLPLISEWVANVLLLCYSIYALKKEVGQGQDLCINMRKWQPLCGKTSALVVTLIVWMFADDLHCSSLCMHEQTAFLVAVGVFN